MRNSFSAITSNVIIRLQLHILFFRYYGEKSSFTTLLFSQSAVVLHIHVKMYSTVIVILYSLVFSKLSSLVDSPCRLCDKLCIFSVLLQNCIVIQTQAINMHINWNVRIINTSCKVFPKKHSSTQDSYNHSCSRFTWGKVAHFSSRLCARRVIFKCSW